MTHLYPTSPSLSPTSFDASDILTVTARLDGNSAIYGGPQTNHPAYLFGQNVLRPAIDAIAAGVNSFGHAILDIFPKKFSCTDSNRSRYDNCEDVGAYGSEDSCFTRSQENLECFECVKIVECSDEFHIPFHPGQALFVTEIGGVVYAERFDDERGVSERVMEMIQDFFANRGG